MLYKGIIIKTNFLAHSRVMLVIEITSTIRKSDNVWMDVIKVKGTFCFMFSVGTIILVFLLEFLTTILLLVLDPTDRPVFDSKLNNGQ